MLSALVRSSIMVPAPPRGSCRHYWLISRHISLASQLRNVEGPVRSACGEPHGEPQRITPHQTVVSKLRLQLHGMGHATLVNIASSAHNSYTVIMARYIHTLTRCHCWTHTSSSEPHTHKRPACMLSAPFPGDPRTSTSRASTEPHAKPNIVRISTIGALHCPDL